MALDALPLSGSSAARDTFKCFAVSYLHPFGSVGEMDVARGQQLGFAWQWITFKN
jgi:hypothetical protein